MTTTFTDAHGVVVHVHEWPVENPRAVVQISHGLGEYAARYGETAAALGRAGYAVYADDHRGHGETGRQQYDGDLTRLGRLGPGGLAAAEEDVRTLTARLRDQYPGLPLVAFAHSWGSLMAQRIVNRHPGEYDGLLLSGSAYRMPGSMAAGDLNAHHKRPGGTRFEWLSRDPEVVTAFDADPLTFYADVRKLFGLADGLRLFGVPARGCAVGLPIRLLVGSDDSLGGPASVQRLAEAYRRRGGATDVDVVVYPDARHDLTHETNRDEVVADVVAWLAARF